MTEEELIKKLDDAPDYIAKLAILITVLLIIIYDSVKRLIWK